MPTPIAPTLADSMRLFALRVFSFLLRSSPFKFGKATLLRLCREKLAPKLPPFSEDVRLSFFRGGGDRRDGRFVFAPKLTCFQLGGTHHADVLSEWLLYTGTWQPPLTRYLCRALAPGDSFVDVGANTGYFSLLAAARVRGRGRLGAYVVAVEACPKTCERLRANLALNPTLARCIDVEQVAAAEAAGVVMLYQHKRDALYNTTVAGAGAGGVAAGGSTAGDVFALLQARGAVDGLSGVTSAAVTQLASESSCWKEVRVPKRTLDEMLFTNERYADSGLVERLRVVKIDVEGGEWGVIRGMDRLLKTAPHSLEVIVEVTPKWLKLQPGGSAERLMKHMAERGFHPYLLSAEDYEISRCVEQQMSGGEERPRRLRGALEATGQRDVIFSRTVAEWL